MINIVVRSGRFFSQSDEDRLFEWFDSISDIKNVEGVGSSLIISIDDKIDKKSILELIAVICRYNLGISDLKEKLGSIPKHSWINKNEMFWNKFT